MDYDRFAEYLQQVLQLPHAVFESPTFFYSPEALQQCFGRDQHVNVNQFLDTLMGDACPPCLMWLPLLHRMASVERVYHPVMCDACQVGLRMGRGGFKKFYKTPFFKTTTNLTTLLTLPSPYR